MTRTTLTVTTSAAAGTVLPAAVAVDAPNGNQFTNTGRELVHVTNGAAANITVGFTTNDTIYTVGSVAYAIADLNVTVQNGTTKIMGPFDTTLFNDANNLVRVDFSSGTTITINVIKMGTA